MASKVADSAEFEQVQVRVSEGFRDRMDVLAYECSSPGESVDRSEVVRAAFRDYYRKHRSNLEDCEPSNRGEPEGKLSKQVSVKFLAGELQSVEQVAHDCSGPKRSVSRSDVLRAAVKDYIDKHEGDLRECDPLAEGALSGGDR